jgi:hypothetical protein
MSWTFRKRFLRWATFLIPSLFRSVSVNNPRKFVFSYPFSTKILSYTWKKGNELHIVCHIYTNTLCSRVVISFLKKLKVTNILHQSSKRRPCHLLIYIILLHFQLWNTVNYPLDKIDIFTVCYFHCENNKTDCDVMFLILTLCCVNALKPFRFETYMF